MRREGEIPDWLAPFPGQFQAAVGELIESGNRPIACFDADGTLWSEDIGEAFFRWLAAGKLLPRIDPARDPFDVYEEYEERVRKNRLEGFLWVVQTMAGLAEADVRRWAWQMAVAWPNYRPAMRALIDGLTGARCDVWIVSASNVWIIEASAPLIGVDRARALGIRLAVEDGRITDAPVPPVTCNGGKVDAVRERAGRAADIAVGDSLGDLELLESARVPLVVGRTDKPDTEILRIARERGWATKLF